MAGTSDDDSTPGEWLFLRAVRDLAAPYCGGSPAAAERMTIEYAQAGHFTQCRWHGDQLIPVRHWGAAHPEIGLFIPVDFTTNTVTYLRTEPVSDVVTPAVARGQVWELEKTLEEFLLRPPYPEMRLVRLHRDEVLSMLRKAGLLLSAEMPAAAEDSDRANEAGPAKKKTRLGKQEQLLEPVAREIYGPDLPMLLASEFRRAIELARKAGTLATLLPKHWVPDLSACRRFLAKRGKLRAADAE